ncbi:MAG TPA: heme-binding protein, partial [Methylococcales bacterium]
MLKTTRTAFIAFLLPLLLCSCSPSNSENNVSLEKAKYTIIEEKGNIQIRQYQPSIVAETLVDADFNDAGNVAFRRLFNYISGNNRKKESIAMTAPVNQQPSPEKIAMTAPVTQQKTADKFAVSFVMPSKYTMDTLPQPLDQNVVLRQVP